MGHRYIDKSDNVLLQVAKILAETCHHIHPAIVEKIVKNNAASRLEFSSIFPNPLLVDYYFYEGSDCVFPGTRRYINNEKSGKWKDKINKADLTILSDNTYPRHIWTFLCIGQAYSRGNEGTYTTSGLNVFELAHIFSHKVDERHLEKRVFKTCEANIKPYGLFSSAGNIILAPKWLPKPTDKSETLKVVFYKRHLELYRNVSALPGLFDFDESFVPDWYSSIKWPEPDLPDSWEKNVDKLLNYRNKHLRNRYAGYK